MAEAGVPAHLTQVHGRNQLPQQASAWSFLLIRSFHSLRDLGLINLVKVVTYFASKIVLLGLRVIQKIALRCCYSRNEKSESFARPEPFELLLCM